jgi:predicted amidohydrolase YtcJ
MQICGIEQTSLVTISRGKIAMSVADTVLVNANVVTMDAANTKAEAVAIKDGRIVAVGSNEEIRGIAGKTAKIVDVKNRTVLPGFIDSHAHLTGTALFITSLDFHDATSIKEILEMVRKRAQESPKDKLILGYRLDETKYAENRYPSRSELDSVAPDHYVLLLHESGHAGAVNTRSLRYMNFPANEQGVDKDPETGEPTGTIRDPAIVPTRVKIWNMIGDEELKQILRIAAEDAAKVGLTTIHTVGEGLDIRKVRRVEGIAKELPVRVLVYSRHQVPEATGDIDKDVEAARRNAGMKLVADGAIETHTAALFEPYADDPSTKGMLYYTQEYMNELVLKAHKAGVQLAIHCESDASIDQVLNAYENALNKHPRKDHRHRIEHYELATEEQHRRVARLGVALGMQPAFIYLWGGADGKYRHYLGDERMRRAHTYRDLLRLGILIAGGSDSPITPWNPILGVHSLVNHPNVNQRVSVYDALKIFTINGARIAFEEDRKGSIETGKFADLVILSDDPLVTEPSKIKEIGVLMTIVSGNTVYVNPEFAKIS